MFSTRNILNWRWKKAQKLTHLVLRDLFMTLLCVQPIKLSLYHVSEQQRLTVVNQLFFKPILDSPVGESFKLFVNPKLDNSAFQLNGQCEGINFCAWKPVLSISKTQLDHSKGIFAQNFDPLSNAYSDVLIASPPLSPPLPSTNQKCPI